MDCAHEKRASEIRRRIYSKMSYAQKYEQLMMLRRFAWDLKAAALRQQHPELSEEEIDMRVAREFLHATT
jgi:hypothetical protein